MWNPEERIITVLGIVMPNPADVELNMDDEI